MESESSFPHLQGPATCPCPEPDQSNPCLPTLHYERYILIFPFHLLLDLPSGFFYSSISTKTLCAPLLSPVCAKCPVHLILLDFNTRIVFGEE